MRADSANDPAIPAAGKRLTDLAQSLNATEQTQVIGKLKEIEEKTSAQVAVLIVDTTQPQSIEKYAVRVVEAWKISQAKVDDGLLIVITEKDGKVRMEVGSGPECTIPDLTAKHIIDQAMLPLFGQGKYAAGLIAGLDQVPARIQLEVKTVPPAFGGQHAGQVA